LRPSRFPPPWSVEEQPACFVVRDHNGRALAYAYFEDEPGRRSAGKRTGLGGFFNADDSRQNSQDE
jgi:hypothetical protein